MKTFGLLLLCPMYPMSFERALQSHLCAALLFVVGPKLPARLGYEGQTRRHASTSAL